MFVTVLADQVLSENGLQLLFARFAVVVVRGCRNIIKLLYKYLSFV